MPSPHRYSFLSLDCFLLSTQSDYDAPFSFSQEPVDEEKVCVGFVSECTLAGGISRTCHNVGSRGYLVGVLARCMACAAWDDGKRVGVGFWGSVDVTHHATGGFLVR